MIVTLTMNPALDRTVDLAAALVPGEVQPALSEREDPGGKGVNVARVIAGAGTAVTAVLPLSAQDPYRALLGDLPVRTVAVEGRARANLTLTDRDGVTTKVNLPGPVLGDAEVRALIDAVVEAADGATWLALCGSLPRGVASDFYVAVARAVRSRAVRPPRIAVDTSGPALEEVVAAGAVDLIKPNDIELAELVAGLALREGEVTTDAADALAERLQGELAADPTSARDIARALVPARVGAALITLGGDGAVLVDAEGAWFGRTPPTRVRSTVGAGDSALAGFLLAHAAGEGAEGRLRSAIRYGSATASLPGTRLAAPGDLTTHDVLIHSLA